MESTYIISTMFLNMCDVSRLLTVLEKDSRKVFFPFRKGNDVQCKHPHDPQKNAVYTHKKHISLKTYTQVTKKTADSFFGFTTKCTAGA